MAIIHFFFIFSDVKDYHHFYLTHASIAQSPTYETCNTPTLINQILESVFRRVSQKGAIYVGISDRRVILSRKKIYKMKARDIYN